MIFIVNEQILNGTVTMNLNTYGIVASDFEEAKEKLCVHLTKHVPDAEIGGRHLSVIHYDIPNQPFGVHGFMKDTPLRMLED